MKRLALAIVLAALSALSLRPAVVRAQSDSETTRFLEEAEQAMRQQNYPLALSDYRKAAETGNAEAQMRVGLLYLNGGPGLQPDYSQALAWSLKAAAQGNAGAMLNLGLIYRRGLGVDKDASKALEYFRAAQAAGQFKASRYIGLYYAEAGDDKKAAAAYRQAAEAGDITSQYYLGQAYERGKGVDQDFALAFQWYTKAAERGDHIASDGMVGLASLYEHGEGVPRDMDKATALYRQAAALDNKTALEALKRLQIPAE